MSTDVIWSLTKTLTSAFFSRVVLRFLVVAVCMEIASASAGISDDNSYDNDQLTVYEGSFELLDVYGTKANLQYSHSCLSGDADTCQMLISVPAAADELEQLEEIDDVSLGYLNYLSYLKSTGQSLQVRFAAAVPAASDTSLLSYRVFYTTQNKSGRMIKNMDTNIIPTRLQKNPLLLFAILATHQSSLDLVLSPQSSLCTLYTLSVARLEYAAY